MKKPQNDFHGLLHSADLVEAELRRRLAPLSILPRQARILEAMGRIGPASQSDLASAFRVSSASMSTMTDRLLANGYITRRVDPTSRRRHVLELTEKGQVLLTGIIEAWEAVDETIRQALGPNAEPFFEMARQLRDSLGGTIPGAQPAEPDAEG
ncbi:MarR family transcriptional regulator [Vannielia sp.]|uniref:MarR family winged helix-turn-helix transcriptional regulator n=1 Tax=Vannielia sp. TaxID=2813045 RepID=UPI00261F3BAC|nr:MarR family transcriptional regulator [Vannielia sp.]MDF1873844.1 MarR family transcriptional regulator [Vannielia sp.]